MNRAYQASDEIWSEIELDRDGFYVRAPAHFDIWGDQGGTRATLLSVQIGTYHASRADLLAMHGDETAIIRAEEAAAEQWEAAQIEAGEYPQGERSMTHRVIDAREWANTFKIAGSLDTGELPGMSAARAAKFVSDPFQFMLRATEAEQRIIWDAVGRRQRPAMMEAAE